MFHQVLLLRFLLTFKVPAYPEYPFPNYLAVKDVALTFCPSFDMRKKRHPHERNYTN